ncbi:polyphenol oxidase family protein [Candidatus Dependentiae bacterium]|nr:polyphenol oxidase family protein [Candidatus Dependentiae bacterium]
MHQDIISLFGNKQNSVTLEDIKSCRYAAAFQKIVLDCKLERLIVLNQTHSAFGWTVNFDLFKSRHSFYEYSGDFLITDMHRCGLIVLTADCLPIILYDVVKRVVGIVHSGWKGSVEGVVIAALSKMQKDYRSQVENVKVFYGASAGGCCYEVKDDFMQQFFLYDYAQKAFEKRNNRLYFNNKMFVTLQLLSIGISLKNIYDEQVQCTICSFNYCSFRREKNNADRQISMVSLI